MILVGEIRDSDTAKTAVHAAMTGHLVLSTLHATDSISALGRLVELGIERSVACSVVLGVVAQRLVRVNCPACAKPDEPQTLYLECLGISTADRPALRHSPGCDECRFTGARGRIGVYELLEIDGRIRELCVEGDESRIRKAAREAGFRSLIDQAVSLVVRGEVSAAEAYRSAYFGG